MFAVYATRVCRCRAAVRPSPRAPPRKTSSDANCGFPCRDCMNLFGHGRDTGLPGISIYGFRRDDTKRSAVQNKAFAHACAGFAQERTGRGAAVLERGDEDSRAFPRGLPIHGKRRGNGMTVKFLVHDGWGGGRAGRAREPSHARERCPRIDLVVWWGRRPPFERLSPDSVGLCRRSSGGLTRVPRPGPHSGRRKRGLGPLSGQAPC